MAIVHALLAGSFVVALIALGFYGLLTESKKHRADQGEDVSEYRWWIALSTCAFNLAGAIFIMTLIITVAMLAYR